MRQNLTRGLSFTAGVVMVGFGVACMLVAHLGVSPFDVANSGVAAVTGWDVGTASWLVAAGLVAAAWAVGRRPRAGTVANAFGVGVVINAGLAVLPDHVVGLPLRVAMVAGGMCLIWTGIVGLVCADVGAGPAEELMLSLVARGLPMREVRWGIEAALFGVGWLLGGQVGAGSAVFVLATGPVIAWAIPRGARLLRLEPCLPELPGEPAELR